MNDIPPLWQNLLIWSHPARQGESLPPYGFSTRFVAELRSQRDKDQLEKLSYRALFVALLCFFVMALVTGGVLLYQQETVDPTTEMVVPIEPANLTDFPSIAKGATDV